MNVGYRSGKIDFGLDTNKNVRTKKESRTKSSDELKNAGFSAFGNKHNGIQEIKETIEHLKKSYTSLSKEVQDLRSCEHADCCLMNREIKVFNIKNTRRSLMKTAIKISLALFTIFTGLCAFHIGIYIYAFSAMTVGAGWLTWEGISIDRELKHIASLREMSKIEIDEEKEGS